MMQEASYPIDSTGPVSLASGRFSSQPGRMTAGEFRVAIGWLPIVVIAGIGTWLLFGHASKPAGGQPLLLATAAATHQALPVTVGLAKGQLSFDPSTAEAITPEQPAPVDGLKISSQSWRRGGLGSNAFVTMTLRNADDYAVKNVEISCAFTRPDGSHLTDRTRLIHDAVNMKSRKTFARMHVGFVNVNASNARCSLLAASHI